MRLRMLIAGLALLVSGACGSDSTTPASVADAAQLPADQVIYGLRLTMTKDGVRTGELQSDTAFVFEEGRRLDLRTVRLRFFAETGHESGNLTSRTGEYHLGTGAFLARGQVVLVTHAPEGDRTVETEELHYDVANDQLWSDVPFKMTQNGRTTYGDSFRSDARFETWTVNRARTEGGLPETGTGISF